MRCLQLWVVALFLFLSGSTLVASAGAINRRVEAIAVAPAPLLSETFSTTASSPNLWATTGQACLTAGNAQTPSSSIPACGALASADVTGSGALQLTQSAANLVGAAIAKVPLSTAAGVVITFTDAAFGTTTGTGTGADGMSVFLADARLQLPTVSSASFGGELGYLGLIGGYLGIGFDEYGNFSSSDGKGTPTAGYPGRVPETVAIRGAFSAGNQYIGGYTGTTGSPISLPFPLDAPTLKIRSARAPTIRITVTPVGLLTIEIDPHDGNGYRTTYSAKIIGVKGQPGLPPQVYLGFAAGTGRISQIHQIENLSVLPITPATEAFAPTQIANLAAWYDASDATTIAQTAKSISAWRDKSGNNRTITQNVTSQMPSSDQNIDGLNAIGFAGGQFLSTGGTAFSSNVTNESTTFVVTNALPTAVAASVISAGAPPGDNAPRWDLRLFESGVTHFDFNNLQFGRIAAPDQYAGPAFWTAAGSASANSEYLRKNGNTIGTLTGPKGTTTSAYPLVVGGNFDESGALTYPFHGTIGELIIYNRMLSATETATVEGYIACKWGLQSRLPANHPYRTLCPGAPPASPLPTPTPSSGALTDPPQLRSSNGQLSLSIVATVDTSGNPRFSYNGSTIPPTLRVIPGDIVSVSLTNSLPSPPAGAAYRNDTNLHFHGLHVSPNAPGDDSIDMLALPGQSLHYQFAIPYNHPPGLYWYHSHAHGEVERQNLSGMSGAFIVDGIAQFAPSVMTMPERVLIVRDAPLAGQALPNADLRQLYAMGWAMQHAAKSSLLRFGGSHGNMTLGNGSAVRSNNSRISVNPYVILNPNFRRLDKRRFDTSDGHCVGSEAATKLLTVNGALQPSIGIRPGERQFWRLVNAGSDTYLDVAVDNAQMQIVALDGAPLSSGVNTPSTMLVNDYVVPPASRVEFIVTGPPSGTTAYLRTKCFDAGASGIAMPATTLAVINPNASSVDAIHKQRVSAKMVAYKFPRRASLTQRKGINRSALSTLATVPVSRTQTLYYSDQNTINGQSYDPGGAPQFYAQTGTVEEWTILNNSSQVHTFHIHQIHFVVEAINGVTQSAQLLMDNANVPAASASGPGSIKILLDFTDPTIIGTFLLHCHILSHEDAGMMAKIRVGTAPPLTLNSTALSFASSKAATQAVSIGGGKAPYSVSGCAGVASAIINGTNVSTAAVAAGSCILTIADSTDESVTLAVSVAAAAAAITVSPSALSFTSPTASAQNATITGGIAPYFITGCADVARSSINAGENGGSVAPISTGSCTLTVTDSGSNTATIAVSVNAVTVTTSVDNLTFHHDAGRTGWYQSETSLTTANVASTSFKLLGTLTAPSGMPAFGKVYAQPLFVSKEKTADGSTHNLVVIATSTDQVYAIDETTHGIVWEHNFTNAASGITQQVWTDTGCGDVNPNVGITGTPVIDRALDRLFVVVPTKENGTFHMRLHALSLSTGADSTSPVEVAAAVALATGGTATVSAEGNFNRGALLEANGNIYVPLGSHCDYGAATVHGWILAYSASTLAVTGNALDSTSSNTGSNKFLGSIWMSGFGPAADASGNVFFATGNGPYDGVSDFSMSAIRVPGNLDMTKASVFTPFGAVADSNADADLASGGVVLLPTVNASTPRMMFAGGKCGSAGTAGTQGCQKYLLNRDNLGGFKTGDVGAVWHGNSGGGLWGGPAAFQDAGGTTYLVYGTGNPISTYTLGLAPVSLTIQSTGYPGCMECRNQGSQPIVSSNGTVAGTAVAWALKTPGNAGGNLTLYAFDALEINHTLFTGVAGTWTVGTGASYIGGALISPTVANGRVYVPTDGGVAVFGLSQ